MSGNTASGRLSKAKAQQIKPPQPDQIKVIPPTGLTKKAKEYWHGLITSLIQRKIYDSDYDFPVSRLAELFDLWLKAKKELKQRGLIIEAVTDRGALVIRENPAMKISISLNKEIKDLERKMGLTPLDRIGSKKTVGDVRNDFKQ